MKVELVTKVAAIRYPLNGDLREWCWPAIVNDLGEGQGLSLSVDGNHLSLVKAQASPHLH